MKLPEWLGRDKAPPPPAKGGRGSFVERNVEAVSRFLTDVIVSNRYSGTKGLVQGVDPGARVFGVVLIILGSAFAATHWFTLGVLVLAFLLARLSGVGPIVLAKRAMPPVVFTAAIALPVVISPVTPGEPLAGVFGVWVTREGLAVFLKFLARVASMVAMVSLLVVTTRQADFFRGLGRFPLPGFFTTALFVTFRYMFLLLKAVEDSSLARKSRTITGTAAGEDRRWFASRAGFLLKKSLATADEVALSMASRGFSGRLATRPPGELAPGDYAWIGASAFVMFLSFGL